MTKKLLVIALVLFCTFRIAAHNISGVVLDSQDQPLPGVTVIVKGTTEGTVTDVNGNFTLTLNNSSDKSLEFRFVGFVTQELPIGNRNEFKITMLEDTKQMNEVIVVGYGTQRKSDVTGSISVVGGSDLSKQQSFDALSALKGKASGVDIMNSSGSPGASPRVIIRGISSLNSSTDPLYVVDGVAMSDFSNVNPNDIEKVEVLKDASAAAIYGSRGANGVIMVTTKRGLTDQGTRVTYNGSVTAGTMEKYMSTLNATQWMGAYKEGLENANAWYGGNLSTNLADYFTDPALFNSDGSPKYNTNWQREATRTAISQNHQLSIQKGGKDYSSGAFINYSDQEGLLLNTYMKRVNAKLTFDTDANKWLSTSFNLMINHNWGNVTDLTGGGQSPRRTIIEMVPWMPVQFTSGTYAGQYSNSSMVNQPYNLQLEGIENPVHVLQTQQNMRYYTQIFGNAALTFHIIPGLDLKTQLGVDTHLNEERDYSPTDLLNISFPNGNAYIDDSRQLYWQEETYLTYNKVIKDHRFSAMLGLSWQETVGRDFGCSSSGFSDNFSGSDNIGNGTIPGAPVSSYWASSMNSYFLRGTYSYQDKYMATLTARYDGASQFGANNKYGFFPSLGLGWLISNEDFMKNITAIDVLKLHASYGVLGNSNIGNYPALASINTGTVLLNGQRQPSSYVGNLANPDLKWERTGQYDAGFNLNMYKNRLNFDVSFYYKKTTDLLMNMPVPYSSGFQSVTKNIGSLANKGIDFMVNTVNINTHDFQWSSTLNFNYNKNKILSLGEHNEDIFPGPWWVGGSQTILRVGEPVSSFYGFQRQGIWGVDQQAAAEANGQEVGQAIRSQQEMILGKGIPGVTGSFINTFKYKKFDLTVDLQFVLGVQIAQQFFHSTQDRFGYSSGLSSLYTDAWTPQNTNTLVQAVHIATLGNNPEGVPMGGMSTGIDSHWICNGSYLRGNNLQIGYTFGKNPAFQSMRVYFGVTNAFVLNSKNFLGYDPEGTSWDATDVNGGGQWSQNMFFFEYPQPRNFILGLTATF
jgi:TonB-linked SusC/RagA family outer membrane protein